MAGQSQASFYLQVGYHAQMLEAVPEMENLEELELMNVSGREDAIRLLGDKREFLRGLVYGSICFVNPHLGEDKLALLREGLWCRIVL